MAHLIVKDRKLCMVNGKYVTSANGAPCVCGGEPTDPGPCDGVPGPLPFEPCAVRVSLSGIQAAFGYQACGNSSCPEDGVVTASGLNRSFVLQDVGGTAGNVRTFSGTFPIHIVFINAFGTGNPCPYEYPVVDQCDVTATVFYCSTNNRWYLSRIAYAASSGGYGFLNFDSTTTGGGDAVAQGVSVQNSNVDNTNGCTGGFFGPYFWGGSARLDSIIGDCTNVEDDNSYVYEAVKCDGSESIWVSVLGATGHKAIYQNELYVLTGTYSETANPVDVDGWTNDDCPIIQDPDESEVWERCRSGGNSIIIPNRVRCSSPSVQGADYMYSEFDEHTPQVDHPECLVRYRIAYRRIEDDDGDYPRVGGHPSDGPCSNMRDNGRRYFCKPVDDAGDPQDPNNPAITDPGIKRTLPVQDLSGYDIEREVRAARQGGCCGSPTK